MIARTGLPLALGVALWLALDARAAREVPPPAPAPSADDACADCHPSIVASWSESSMSRALEALQPNEIEGLEPVHDEATGYRYHFEGARLVETLPPGGSGPPHRLATTLAFAVGAGQLDRSYVARSGGRMWFAPLEVVSAGKKGRHAALAPGHTITPGLRFSFPITPECLGCHTDTMPPRAFPLNVLPATDVWQPRGISCTACHGEGDGHVTWRERELAGEDLEGADPIVVSTRLDRNERMSVCAACHLQGDARIDLSGGLGGPPPPGGDILERRAVFVAREPGEEIGFVSQTERLVLSRCYLESGSFPDGGLVCESCHDPHRSTDAPRERARLRAACLDCHPRGHAPEADEPASACSRDPMPEEGRDCVDCHMKLSGVFDVADVEIHDHFIRADPGPPVTPGTLRFPEDPNGDWRRFAWPATPPPEHDDDPGLWMMALVHGGHLERAAGLVDRSGPVSATLPMYHHVRASLLERIGRPQDARAAYRRALSLDPELAESQVNLGLLVAKLGDEDEGLRLLTELIEKHPRADSALRNRAVIHSARGDWEAFFRDVERALRLLPDAGLANALSKAYGQQGREAQFRKWAAEARRLDPVRFGR